MHICWLCKDTQNCRDPAILATNRFTKAVDRAVLRGEQVALWTRGLPSHDWATTEAQSYDAEQALFGVNLDAFAGCAVFGTDGSGGKFAQDPVLRRCGASAIGFEGLQWKGWL